MNCPSCGSAKLIHDTRDIPYSCEGESIKIPAVPGDLCPACGETVLKTAESSRVSLAMLEFKKQVLDSVADERIKGDRS